MLNLKQQRYADRLKELKQEGNQVAALERDNDGYPYITEKVPLNAWLTKTENIVMTVFGDKSSRADRYRFLSKDHVERSYKVHAIVGLLTGALDDLENGFLVGQEMLIAAEVFDSVLEQARYLCSQGYKDAAAVLTRVVLEDALKRLARQHNVGDGQKASVINDGLKATSAYSQVVWRQVLVMLDIGNKAAHGKFQEYTQEQVARLIEDVTSFLGSHLTS